MNVAANYLGTLVKRDVHISAQEFIQNHIVRQARKLLAGTSDSVNSISVFLGFTYPNHFTRLFTKKEGITPTAYRRMNRMSGKA